MADIFLSYAREDRSRQISRILTESAGTFNQEVTARHYIVLCQKLLRHPVVTQMTEEKIVSFAYEGTIVNNCIYLLGNQNIFEPKKLRYLQLM